MNPRKEGILLTDISPRVAKTAVRPFSLGPEIILTSINHRNLWPAMPRATEFRPSRRSMLRLRLKCFNWRSLHLTVCLRIIATILDPLLHLKHSSSFKLNRAKLLISSFWWILGWASTKESHKLTKFETGTGGTCPKTQGSMTKTSTWRGLILSLCWEEGNLKVGMLQAQVTLKRGRGPPWQGLLLASATRFPSKPLYSDRGNRYRECLLIGSIWAL